jgi:hypothetical protein
MKTALAAAVAATLIVASGTTLADPPAKSLKLQVLGTFGEAKYFDEGAAEITSYDPRTRRAFVVNAGAGTVDVLDLSDPATPTKVVEIDVDGDLQAATGIAAGNANSVAVKNGIVAVAVENDDKQANGWVAFYDAGDLGAGLTGWAEVGALPDMVTFSDDGMYVLTANEGEPNDDYDVDPEGSVSVVNVSGGVAGASVMTAGFGAFTADALRAQGVRIFGPGATAAQDLEPEYIVTAGSTAWVTLQENNAVAIVDIPTATVQAIVPLGYKDHSRQGNALDPSNRDGGINIATWTGVKGMYQPDAIASYEYRGRTFLVTANEGDARDYDGFSEEARGADLYEDGIISTSDVPGIDENAQLGRLNSTTAPPYGDTSNLYAYGARSFSIWDGATGALVFDSGDALEKLIAAVYPDDFNSTNDENDSFDNRSDDKGPEPEGVVIGRIEGRTYAFIGLERIGGIVAYDVSNPYAPVFMDYLNNRNFDPDADCEAFECGDLGPEGLHFVAKEDSPNGQALLIVGNEISGTTTVYGIDVRPANAQGPKKK